MTYVDMSDISFLILSVTSLYMVQTRQGVWSPSEVKCYLVVVDYPVNISFIHKPQFAIHQYRHVVDQFRFP